jgi:hypothetical protein
LEKSAALFTVKSMYIIVAIAGALLIVIVLGDVFETIVFPRRVTRRIRLARLFYRVTWIGWSTAVRGLCSEKRKETYLSFFGPMSLLLLLTIWAAGLIIGFASLHWAVGSGIKTPTGETPGFGTDLYFSGTTFFTLGLGDIAPRTAIEMALTVVEAGVGFGLLALVIGYLPALNQSFSRREINISLLDAHAGSPPSASEMLSRHCSADCPGQLCQTLAEWEKWTAELLESHLSYPVLAYFRSQHDNQSWLGAITTILDTSAFILANMEDPCKRQARMTFAMARHAVADLSIVFRQPPRMFADDRLKQSQFLYLREVLKQSGLALRDEDEADGRLSELRRMYEPYVYSLSGFLHIAVPPWISEPGEIDNWQKSEWEPGPGTHF